MLPVQIQPRVISIPFLYSQMYAYCFGASVGKEQVHTCSFTTTPLHSYNTLQHWSGSHDAQWLGINYLLDYSTQHQTLKSLSSLLPLED